MKLFAHELCCAIINAFTSQSINIRLRWEGTAAETLPCKLQSRAYGVQDWLPMISTGHMLLCSSSLNLGPLSMADAPPLTCHIWVACKIFCIQFLS
jgi:hypothetical protein